MGLYMPGVRQTIKVCAMAIMLLSFDMRGKAYAGEIHEAVKARNTAEVARIISTQPDAVNSVTEEGSTPLHLAVGMNDTELAQLLIQNGANVNAGTGNGYTPLHLAAYVDAGECMRLLLSHGADARIVTGAGHTPFRLAILRSSANAVRVLLESTPCAYTERFLDARSDEGQISLKDGELRMAQKLIFELVKQFPQSERINFAYGLCCYSLADYLAASLAYERVLQANPGNQRAVMELACSHQAGGQEELARTEFEKVLAQNPAPEIKRQIEDYMKQIGKKQNWRLMGRVDAGCFDDNNVNVGPELRVVNIAPNIFDAKTLTVDETSLPVSSKGYYTAFTGLGVRDIGKKGGWFMTADLSYYQNWMNDAPDNEVLFYQAGSGMRRLASRSLLEIPVKASHITSGGDPLINMYGIDPAYRFASGPAGKMHWITSGSAEMRDYDELNNRDGIYMSFGETVQNFFGPENKHNISMGILFFQDNADEPAYQNSGSAWNLGVEMKASKNTTVYSKVQKTSTTYDKRENLAPEKRVDAQNHFVAGINKKIGGGWSVDANYQKIDKNSTFGLYQYERDIATLSVSYTF